MSKTLTSQSKIDSGKNNYFSSMAILMIVLAVGGFSVNGIINHDKMPSIYPLLLLHIFVMVGWYTLFVVQTELVGRGKRTRHMQLGRWSLLLSIGILVTGASIIYTSYTQQPDPLIVGVNFGALFGFTVAYFCGYLWRNHPKWHKRAMLLAGIAILPPALARLVIAVGLPEPVVFVLYFLLIASLIAYDIIRQGKPHRVSLIGGLVIIICLAVGGILGSTEAWASFLEKIWG